MATMFPYITFLWKNWTGLNKLPFFSLSNHPESSGSSSEEYPKMYLKMWRDHASIAGASHLALMIQILHDNKVHAADPASQTLIEKPRLWLLARSLPSRNRPCTPNSGWMTWRRALTSPLFPSPTRCQTTAGIMNIPCCHDRPASCQGGAILCSAAPNIWLHSKLIYRSVFRTS